MKTIFVGGSRNVTKLPPEILARLDTVIEQRHRVIVGDANGADKAVQKYLAQNNYADVVLYCSGDKPRNNVGEWKTKNIIVQSKTKDYQYFAAKDREMAHDADFGLMIWDGKSPGTLLNIVRLLHAGKIAVLYHLPEQAVVNFKTAGHVRDFISNCPKDIRGDLDKRATADEKRFLEGHGTQPSLLEGPKEEPTPPDKEFDAEVKELNRALVSGDVPRIIRLLGDMARSKGMGKVADDAGRSRESLYRSLSDGGNPEFATVMKVLASLGVALEIKAPPRRDGGIDR